MKGKGRKSRGKLLGNAASRKGRNFIYAERGERKRSFLFPVERKKRRDSVRYKHSAMLPKNTNQKQSSIIEKTNIGLGREGEGGGCPIRVKKTH